MAEYDIWEDENEIEGIAWAADYLRGNTKRIPVEKSGVRAATCNTAPCPIPPWMEALEQEMDAA